MIDKNVTSLAFTSIRSARRGYVVAKDEKPKNPRRPRQRSPLPQTLLGFDCETLPDESQRLTFGSAVVHEKIAGGNALDYSCTMIVLFYADGPDVPVDVESRICNYAANVYNGEAPIEVMPQRDFLQFFYRLAVTGRALVYGFNLPFDLSRISRGSRETRQHTRGGFSLILWPKEKADGTLDLDDARRVRNAFWKPVVKIKSLGPKKASIELSRCHTRSEAETYIGYAEREVARIRAGRRKAPWETCPENPLTRYLALIRDLFMASRETYADERARLLEELIDTKFQYKGCFVDVSTLCRALTDRGGSLATQCNRFGVEHKGDPGGHPGWAFDDDYIAYNLRDTRITSALLFAALADFYAHPIDLDPWKAYSSASIGKSYFRAWGITPPRERWPDFPKDILGICTRTFNGGATNVYHRRCPLPVVYTDLVSAYPTINGLLDTMALWRASDYQIVECRDDVQALLDSISYEECLDRAAWPSFGFFAQIELDGRNLVPVRGTFMAGDSLRIALAHTQADEPDWFAGPDIVASVLATGSAPRVARAFRIEPVRDATGHVAMLPTLRTVDFAGVVPIDPRTNCVPVELINERKRAKKNDKLSDAEKSRVDTGLKCVANSSWYGTAVEKNVGDQAEETATIVYSGSEPFDVMTTKPETNGEYAFEPIGALITAGAHLLLQLVRSAVQRRGGSYVLEDTDSCAIIATEAGGLVPCPNGQATMPDGRPAVHALSWADVREVVADLEPLNPYDTSAVGRSILKIEDANFVLDADSKPTDVQWQLYAFTISSKRYALFRYSDDGSRVMVQVSESGLGGIMSPIAGDTEGRWIVELWKYIVDEYHDPHTPEPPWFTTPVVCQFPISSVVAHRAFVKYDAGKTYDQSVKPYTFAMTARLGLHLGPNKPRAVAPFDRNSEKWLRVRGGTPWFDLKTQKRMLLGNGDDISIECGQTPVKLFRDLAYEHARHLETKMATVDGEPHGTRDDAENYSGPLIYRSIRIAATDVIGKESTTFDNELDIVLGELASDRNEEIAVFYRDEAREALRLLARDVPLSYLQEKTGFGKRKLTSMLYAERRGRDAAWSAIEKAAWYYLHLHRSKNAEAIATVRKKRMVRERNHLARELQRSSRENLTLAEAKRRAEAQLREEMPKRIADAFAIAGIG